MKLLGSGAWAPTSFAIDLILGSGAMRAGGGAFGSGGGGSPPFGYVEERRHHKTLSSCGAAATLDASAALAGAFGRRYAREPSISPGSPFLLDATLLA